MSETKAIVHSFESFGAADGPGVRFIIFLKGCKFRCQYCHNPDTWAGAAGQEMTPDEVLKKALRCIAEATIFFVLCCAIYTIGNLKHQPEGALQCVSFVTYVVLWFYTLNILKNLKKMFKRDTTPWLIVSFLYYILRFKFIERIPGLTEYLSVGRD